MKELGVAEKWSKKLKLLLPNAQEWKESELDAWLEQHLPKLGPKPRKLIKDALAIAAYRSQTAWPVIELLICDDAPQCNWLTVALALCWIHEYRHDKKLIPRIPYHRERVDRFKESFWELYDKLLAYRHHPNQQDAHQLQGEFEQLFEQTTGYQQLDERLALTLAKKEALLMVLSHPEILLHNNPAELGARQRVRKRDVSEASTHHGRHSCLGYVSDACRHRQEAQGEHVSVFLRSHCSNELLSQFSPAHRRTISGVPVSHLLGKPYLNLLVSPNCPFSCRDPLAGIL